MLKAEAINQAYAEIRISGLTTQEVPEEVELALRELDQLMWQWHAMGRNVNYNFPLPTPGQELVVSNPSDVFGVEPWAIQGVITALARNLVSYFGKEIPPPLAAKARFGLTVIMQRTFKAPPVPYPNRMPIGSGNNLRWAGVGPRFYDPQYLGRAPVDPIVENQVITGYFDFSNDMPSADIVLQAFQLYTSPPEAVIMLLAQSQTGNVVNYTLEGVDGFSEVALFCNGLLSNFTTVPKVQRYLVVDNQLVVANA